MRSFKSRSTTARKRRNRFIDIIYYTGVPLLFTYTINKGGYINNSMRNRVYRSHPCYFRGRIAEERSRLPVGAHERLRLVTFIYDTPFILSMLLSTRSRSADTSSGVKMNKWCQPERFKKARRPRKLRLPKRAMLERFLQTLFKQQFLYELINFNICITSCGKKNM